MSNDISSINGISITNFKIIYICPDHNAKYQLRKQHTESLLKQMGFTNIVHYKSGTKRYPYCLAKATYKILYNNLKDPFILVEDDIEFNDLHYQLHESLYHDSSIKENLPIITKQILDKADAIYLGISRYAGHPTINYDNGRSKVISYDHLYVKVINMLSTHAILYLSRQYKIKVLLLMKDIIRNDVQYNTDVKISRIQKHFNILALRKPLFYQSDKLDNPPLIKHATLFRIDTDGRHIDDSKV